jgi:hypothetical protein
MRMLFMFLTRLPKILSSEYCWFMLNPFNRISLWHMIVVSLAIAVVVSLPVARPDPRKHHLQVLPHLGRHTLACGQQVFLAQNEPLEQSASDLHCFSLPLQILTMHPQVPLPLLLRKQKQFLFFPQGEKVPPQVAGLPHAPDFESGYDFARACPGNQEASAIPAVEPAMRRRVWRRDSFSSARVFVMSSNQFAIVISFMLSA